MENLNAEQIKKALEYCTSKFCFEGEGCPLVDVGGHYDIDECTKELVKNAFALINEQEQRIEELTEENAPKWIPIESNEKPQHLKNYFIAYVFGDSDMRFYGEAKYHAYGGNGIIDGAHFSNEGVDDMRVTHWMPIPKLP